jgi:hypothetical protein
MTTNDNSTSIAINHHGILASFTTQDTDIETMFVLFKAALIAMTYQQCTIDDEILRMAEEINNDKKPLINPFKQLKTKKMTREELNKQLQLPNEINNNEKFSGDLHLRNYIELRLIADALIGINYTLSVSDEDTMLNRIQSIAENGENLTDEIVELRNIIRHNNQ